MDTQTGHVMNLANSIIGVSILAMPYCFQQCGIILSIVLLIITNIVSRLTCHFLLKSALMSRRKTFEYLAFYIFGSFGKFFIEVGIIGFLIGTCIAFFVVMGDLGPQIIAEITGTETTHTMRTSILMALALFCVLPLGLLRNVDSLNGVSKATIGFYFCLILKIIIVALPHLFSGDWIPKVSLWKVEGILQCLPIFAMALSCQTQLFEIYQVIQNASLEKMNRIVATAVNICTCVYICVGLFGYIAFSSRPFTGNILSSFNLSASNSAIKIGFIFSLAFSFPLVIFPCRASLNSLLYKGSYSLHDGVGNYMPEAKFKSLTFVIVFTSLLIGIMIPNIEVVLGLVGSTIGVMICVLFPVTSFICITQKNTNERIIAQVILFLGVLIMVLSTYANLYAVEKAVVNPVTLASNYNQLEARDKVGYTMSAINMDSLKKDTVIESPAIGNNNESDDGKKRSKKKKIKNVSDVKVVDAAKETKIENKDQQQLGGVKEMNRESPQLIEPIKEVKHEPLEPVEAVKEIRHEPPQPIEPVEDQEIVVAVDPLQQVTESVKVEKIESNKIDNAIQINAENKKDDKTVEKIESNNIDNAVQINAESKKDDKIKVQADEPPKTEEKDLRESIIENVDKIEKKIDDNIQKIQQLAETNNKILEGNQEIDKKPKTADASEKKESNLNQVEPKGDTLLQENLVDNNNKNNEKKNDEVDIEAIKKEEKELKEQEKQEKDTVKEDKEKVLIETLQKQNEVQKELVEQQRKIIMEVLKNQEKQNNPDVDKEKLNAVRRIENVAKKAIESISGKETAAKSNPEEKPKQETGNDKEKSEKNNSVASNKPIVNAAPLSYQLGLDNQLENLTDTNVNSSDVKTKKILLPLPLVVSNNFQTKANSQAQNTLDKNAEIEPQQEEPLKEEKKDVVVRNEEINVDQKVNDNQDKIKLSEDQNKVKVNVDPDKVKVSDDTKANKEIIKEHKETEDKNDTNDINAIRRDILSERLDRAKRDIENIYDSIALTQNKYDREETLSLDVKTDKNKICVDKKDGDEEEILDKKDILISKKEYNEHSKSSVDLDIEGKTIDKSKTIPEMKDSSNLQGINKNMISNNENDLKISQLLSDPKLISPDLSLLDVKSVIPVKPQTRELKQMSKDEN